MFFMCEVDLDHDIKQNILYDDLFPRYLGLLLLYFMYKSYYLRMYYIGPAAVLFAV